MNLQGPLLRCNLLKRQENEHLRHRFLQATHCCTFTATSCRTGPNHGVHADFQFYFRVATHSRCFQRIQSESEISLATKRICETESPDAAGLPSPSPCALHRPAITTLSSRRSWDTLLSPGTSVRMVATGRIGNQLRRATATIVSIHCTYYTLYLLFSSAGLMMV